MYRKTFVLIDCDQLENNIKEIKRKYSDYKYYFGVVKANCYGHGIECIKHLINGGINYLATSSLEEALKVRKIHKNIPILILEPIHFEEIEIASKNNLTITIDNKSQFDKLIKSNIRIKFHLKIDSGMNRFGLKDKHIVKMIKDASNEDIFMEGIFTQLSSGSGEKFIKEKKNFENITSLIDLNDIPIVHLERSLTMELHKKLSYENGVRLGICMYGFKKNVPKISLKRKIFNFITNRKINYSPSILNIKPVLHFYSEVVEIKSVRKGENVGYGGMYFAKHDIKIAIIPYGFADYLYINNSFVFINNKKYSILVSCMDVTIVLIDDNVKLKDKVEIMGDNISVREASKYAKQNVYKTICSITNRVPRLYKYKNKYKEINY